MNLCKALIHQSVRIRHRAEGNQSAVVVVVVVGGGGGEVCALMPKHCRM